jgi:hypothetical protein
MIEKRRCGAARERERNEEIKLNQCSQEANLDPWEE